MHIGTDTYVAILNILYIDQPIIEQETPAGDSKTVSVYSRNDMTLRCLHH